MAIFKNIHCAARTLSIKDGIGGTIGALISLFDPKAANWRDTFIQVVEYAMSISPALNDSGSVILPVVKVHASNIVIVDAIPRQKCPSSFERFSLLSVMLGD